MSLERESSTETEEVQEQEETTEGRKMAVMSNKEFALEYLQTLLVLNDSVHNAMKTGLLDVYKEVQQLQNPDGTFSLENDLLRFVVEGGVDASRIQVHFKGALSKGLKLLFNLESVE